jgi:hypothetical protein
MTMKFAAMLLLAANVATSDDLIVVPEGDVQALAEAIHEANDRDRETILVIQGTYEFGSQDSLPPITGEVSMSRFPSFNRTSKFEGNRAGPDQLLKVMSGGTLTLGGITLSRFDLSSMGSHEGPLIENHGTLRLENVRVEQVDGTLGGGFCCSRHQDPLIGNYGELQVSATTFLDSGIDHRTGGLIKNMAGSTRIENVLVAQVYGRSFGGAFTNLKGTFEIINDFSGPEDLNQADPGLFRLRIERESFGSELPLLVPSSASLAVDSADPELCPSRALGFRPRPIDGDNDGLAICDRGAVEVFQRALSDGGANGVYFDPDNDGHYLVLTETPFNTLLMWNTFDLDGNQAWVFATGELVNGRAIIAPAFSNENGILTETGPANIDLAIPWGRLQLELDDCNSGRLFFSTERPEFTSGTVALGRLASLRQLGCQD